jgi:hypothetical protein
MQVRRDHRLIAVAEAALKVRQLSEERPAGRRPTARLRRARRRLQRAHIAALRMVGPGQDLFEVLAAVGAVDILPAATIPTGRSGTRPDTRGAQVSAVLTLSDTLSDRSAVLTGGADTGSDTLDGDPSGAIALSDTLSDTPVGLSARADAGSDTLTGDPSGAVHLSETLSDTSAVLAGGADTGLDTLDGDLAGAVHPSDTSAGAGVVLDPLTIAVELVRNDRQVAGSRIAAAMRRHGHTVTDRTGLRWRDRAVNHLATELHRDLSDASNDEVQLAGAAAANKVLGGMPASNVKLRARVG